MRTTVDIPDSVYRELKSRAALEGRSVKELILKSVAVALHKSHSAGARKRQGLPPVLQSRDPGALKLGKEGVYEYISFP
jgi:hypothetical protein